MSEEITVESQKPVRFKPNCIRCGKRTRGKLGYKDIAEDKLDSVLGKALGIPNNDVWVPFCFGCKRAVFWPCRKCLFHVIAAIVLIGVSVYLAAKEYSYSGIILFLAGLVELGIASWKNRGHHKEVLPVRVRRSGKKVVYVFTAGYYYDRMNEKLAKEDREERE